MEPPLIPSLAHQDGSSCPVRAGEETIHHRNSKALGSSRFAAKMGPAHESFQRCPNSHFNG